MSQRHPSKACLIRHRALSRHSRACRRAPRHPPKASRAPLVWLKLGQVGPPCPAPVMMGVSSSQTLLSRRAPIPTGRLGHLFACGNFLNMYLLVHCPTQCACAQTAGIWISCKLSSFLLQESGRCSAAVEISLSCHRRLSHASTGHQ